MNTLKVGCNREMVQNLKPWQVRTTILPSEIINQQEVQEGQQQQQMTDYRQQTSSCSKTIIEQIGSPTSSPLVTEQYLTFSKNGVHQSFIEDSDVSYVPQMKFDHFTHPKEKGSRSYDRSYKMVRCSYQCEKHHIRELKRKVFDVCHGANAYTPGQFGHSRQTSGQDSVNMDLSKTRIKWTQDLHDRFVECVNCLGGAEKATPKRILKLMDSEGVTIYHVKSHLQKYRLERYLPGSAKGKAETKTSINMISQTKNMTGMQFKDALEMQLAIQRQLHEQLEIQRKLQLRIEEQAKQLKKMFDQHQQQKANKSENLEITFSPDDHHSTNVDDDEILNFEDDSEYIYPLSPNKIS